MFAPGPKEGDGKEEDEQWVDVTESPAKESPDRGSPAREIQTKGSPTRQVRGRRPVKFAARKIKDSGRMAGPAKDSKAADTEVKKADKTEKHATDDCASRLHLRSPYLYYVIRGTNNLT